jgi:PHD/YefM family antitoxin component YafN of YafNO toxin-antitoxin module
MNQIPKTLPISDLRFKQAEVLADLPAGPVLFTRQGKAAAVLVDPNQWNRLLERLQDQQDIISILRQELEEERGEAKLIAVDEDELRAWGDEAVPS